MAQGWKLTIKENRRDMAFFEKQPRYDIFINGAFFEQAYWNMTGYRIGLPTPDGTVLDPGEISLAQLRREVAGLNREAAANRRAGRANRIPRQPMRLAKDDLRPGWNDAEVAAKRSCRTTPDCPCEECVNERIAMDHRPLTEAESAAIHRRLGAPPVPGVNEAAHDAGAIDQAEVSWFDRFAWDEAVITMSEQEQLADTIEYIQDNHESDAGSFEIRGDEWGVQLFHRDDQPGDASTTVGFITEDQLDSAIDNAWDGNLEDAIHSHSRWLRENQHEHRILGVRERRAGAAQSAARRRRPGNTRWFGGDPFKLTDRAKRKSDAQWLGRYWRGMGYNARVVPVKGGWAIYSQPLSSAKLTVAHRQGIGGAQPFGMKRCD